MSSAEILELVDIFTDLKASQLERIYSACTPKTYHQGDVIFAENSPSTEFYVILEGKVEIRVNPDTANQNTAPQVIALLDRGQSFGEIALVDQGRRSASAVCGSTTCEVLVIKRQDFMRLMKEDYEMGFWVMSNLAADLCTKIRNTNYRARESLLYGGKN